MKRLFVVLFVFMLVLSACAPKNPDLILATTTSTQDSGLLDVLIPIFEEQTGYKVQTIAVGSGAALKMAEEGNADVLLVHAPSAEETLMTNGWGSNRALIMHNDFVIAGPVNDPVSIRGTDVLRAMQLIYGSGLFVSRADGSGTHNMEMTLWKQAKVDLRFAPARIETGQGMAATLTIASEKQAYTLTDRATFLANRDHLDLDILVEGDAALLNVYHVITVNPAKWTRVNYDGALAFLKFMTDPATQKVIGAFGLDTYGQPLFVPDAEIER
jgi:tungstate transport system substrate-binding protein